jgi:hypothetical protein
MGLKHRNFFLMQLNLYHRTQRFTHDDEALHIKHRGGKPEILRVLIVFESTGIFSQNWHL